MYIRRRHAAEMTLPLNSPTPILYWRSAGIYHLSVTVQKLFECINLAENLAFMFHNMGFLGVLNPICH
jgi:hypothetical protein